VFDEDTEHSRVLRKHKGVDKIVRRVFVEFNEGENFQNHSKKEKFQNEKNKKRSARELMK